jgi:hypothetical protein
MSISQSWLGLPLHGELRQVPNNLCQFREKKVNTVSHENQLRVVSDVAAGCLLKMRVSKLCRYEAVTKG